MNKFVRGSVWWYKRNVGGEHLTSGAHPCVVLSSDNWNESQDTVIVVPGVSDPLPGTLNTLNFKLEQNGYFFPSQITTVPKGWLFQFQGMLQDDESATIVDAANSIISDECDLKRFNTEKIEKPAMTSPEIDKPLNTSSFYKARYSDQDQYQKNKRSIRVTHRQSSRSYEVPFYDRRYKSN